MNLAMVTTGGEVDRRAGSRRAVMTSQGSDAQVGRPGSMSKKLPGENQQSLWESKSLLQQSLTGRHPIEKAMEELKHALMTNPPGVREAALPI